MRIAHINPDPGITRGHKKGAAVHIAAMRAAFTHVAGEVVQIDEGEASAIQRALRNAWKSSPLDMIYERYALNRFAGFEFARLKGIPFVLEINSPLADEDAQWRGGDGWVEAMKEHAMLSSATVIRAVSSQVADYAIRRGASADRLIVRPNAVDPTLFVPRTAHCELRDRICPRESLVIGFHGRLRPWHNLKLLAEALGLLIEKGLPIHFVGVGRGPFIELLEPHVSASRRSLFPWMTHQSVAAYVAAFDILALSYDPQQPCYFSPLKLFEAMAAGVVPIVPRLGDLPSLVAEGKCGTIVKAGDPHALAVAIEDLHRDRSRLLDLSAAARMHAAGYTWKILAAEILSLVAGKCNGCAHEVC